MTKRAAWAVALAVGACGGDDDGSEHEGIYEVDTWTLNDTACGAEGPSVLATQSQTTFYLKLENFLGAKFLNMNFCDDTAECEMLAADEGTIHLGMYGFEGSDGGGWASEWFSGFPDMNEVCQGEYVEAALAGTDQGIRVDVRSTAAGGFAPDADGFCDDEAGKQAAEGQPCTQLEVIAASRVGAL
jgi:hypothetical protein